MCSLCRMSYVSDRGGYAYPFRRRPLQRDVSGRDCARKLARLICCLSAPSRASRLLLVCLITSRLASAVSGFLACT